MFEKRTNYVLTGLFDYISRAKNYIGPKNLFYINQMCAKKKNPINFLLVHS